MVERATAQQSLKCHGSDVPTLVVEGAVAKQIADGVFLPPAARQSHDRLSPHPLVLILKGTLAE